MGNYKKKPLKKSTKSIKKQLKEYAIKARVACAYCGKTYDQKRKMSVDHVVPKSSEGVASLDNLIVACTNCNSTKKCSLPIGEFLELNPKARVFLGKYLEKMKKCVINSRNYFQEISWVLDSFYILNEDIKREADTMSLDKLKKVIKENRELEDEGSNHRYFTKGDLEEKGKQHTEKLEEYLDKLGFHHFSEEEIKPDPEQLRMGIQSEMEHTTNPFIAKVIAFAHLSSCKKYYTYLKEMESEHNCED